MNDMIPVTLLTGFLGSGKTTLLNRLVARPDMAGSLVIINEYGDVSLDHLLVTHSREELVVELSSGCVCCTVRQDLARTLKDVLWRFSRAGQRQFDRVIIETTGLADPIPIVHTLVTNATLAARYRLDGIVTLVDAAAGAHTLTQHGEAVRQAAVADKLLVSKSDLVDAATLQRLQQRLADLNPAAPQLVVERGELDPAELVGLGLFNPEAKSMDVQHWLKQESYVAVSTDRQGQLGYLATGKRTRAAAAAPDKHAERISSFCYVIDEPIDGVAFETAMSLLMELMGPKMLRVKGIVSIRGSSVPVVIHGVQHIFHPPVFLPQWPSDDRRTRVVFITRDVDPRMVSAIFTQAAAVGELASA